MFSLAVKNSEFLVDDFSGCWPSSLAQSFPLFKNAIKTAFFAVLDRFATADFQAVTMDSGTS